MYITETKLNELKNFKTATFALWNPKDHFDFGYVKNNIPFATASVGTCRPY